MLYELLLMFLFIFFYLLLDTEDASETDMVKREEEYTEIKEQ